MTQFGARISKRDDLLRHPPGKYLKVGLQPGYPDRLGSAITPRIMAGSSTSCAPGTRTVACSESMSALAASRVAIWVAVHSSTAQFT